MFGGHRGHASERGRNFQLKLKLIANGGVFFYFARLGQGQIQFWIKNRLFGNGQTVGPQRRSLDFLLIFLLISLGARINRAELGFRGLFSFLLFLGVFVIKLVLDHGLNVKSAHVPRLGIEHDLDILIFLAEIFAERGGERGFHRLENRLGRELLFVANLFNGLNNGVGHID